MCEISHSDRSFVGADQFSIVYFRNSRSKTREGGGRGSKNLRYFFVAMIKNIPSIFLFTREKKKREKIIKLPINEAQAR